MSSNLSTLYTSFIRLWSKGRVVGPAVRSQGSGFKVIIDKLRWWNWSKCVSIQTRHKASDDGSLWLAAHAISLWTMWSSTDVFSDVLTSESLSYDSSGFATLWNPKVDKFIYVHPIWKLWFFHGRYGTLPVVHATGGLVDSVKDCKRHLLLNHLSLDGGWIKSRNKSTSQRR